MRFRIAPLFCRPWTLNGMSPRLIESHYEPLPALLSCTLDPQSFGASPCQSTFEIAVDPHRLVDAIK
jgi:hypothetical protein